MGSFFFQHKHSLTFTWAPKNTHTHTNTHTNTHKQCPGLSDVWGDEFEALYNKYEASGKVRKTIKAQVSLSLNLCTHTHTHTPTHMHMRMPIRPPESHTPCSLPVALSLFLFVCLLLVCSLSLADFFLSDTAGAVVCRHRSADRDG